MYRVMVKDRVMIAHSLRGEIFGPAQQLHGATFVVEATFSRRALDANGIVVDIGLAHAAVAAIAGRVAYKNLDDLDFFAGQNTTVEFLAGWFASELVGKLEAGELGPAPLDGIAVTLWESDVASATFEVELSG